MSDDIEALKTEKAGLIAEMLDMQKKFMDVEHEKGVSGKDYFYSDDGLLKDYREVYMQKAMRVVELSHKIVGSSAF